MQNIVEFDSSHYSVDSPFYGITSSKKVSKIKIVNENTPVADFVGLKCKIYSFKQGDTEDEMAKGILKSVTKNMVKHKDYINTNTDSKNYINIKKGENNKKINTLFKKNQIRHEMKIMEIIH